MKHTNRIYFPKKDNVITAFYRKKVNGRQIRSANFYAPDKTQVDKQISAWLAQGGWEKLLKAKGTAADGGPRTVGDYLTGWFEDIAKKKWHPNTTATYRQDFEKHVMTDPVFIALPFNDILKKADVVAFRERINGSDNTKHNVMKIVHKGFNDAVRLDLLVRNPAAMLPNPPTTSVSRIKAIPDEDEAKLIRYVLSNECSLYWRCFVLFALDTGARREEILGVQLQDIDFASGRVELRRTVVTLKGVGPVVFDVMKTPKSRRPVFVSETTLNALKSYLGQGWGLFDHVFMDPDSFDSGEGRHWTASRLAIAWRKLLKAAKVQHIGLNACRHSVGTRMARVGAIADVAALLGHGDKTTTMKHYLHEGSGELERFANLNQGHFAKFTEEYVKESSAS